MYNYLVYVYNDTICHMRNGDWEGGGNFALIRQNTL